MGYFLAGTPVINGDQKITWKIIKEQVLKNGSNGNATLLNDDEIKQMKLGNLDALLHAGEQMIKLETQVEAFLKKIERQYLDIHVDKHQHDFQIESKNQQLKIQDYLSNFKWEDTIVSKAQSLPDKLLAIKKKLNASEDDFRQKAHLFQEKKNIQQSLTQKEGNLYVKDLQDVLVPGIVGENDFSYTENITTVIAVVPKARLQAFLQKYAEFENVLPQSAKQFTKIEDKEGTSLWKVNFYSKDLHKKVQQEQDENKRQKTPLEQYISWARDNIGVTIREFQYNKNAYNLKQEARDICKREANTAQTMLDQSCKTQFSLTYSCYMHLKILRLYVDIASRFGQKENIVKAIFEVPLAKEKKVQSDLMKLFVSPNQLNMYGTKEELEDTEDFFPYVYIPISIV